MGILQITTDEAAEIGQLPRTVKIVTTDALAVVTAAGYLNPISLLTNIIYPSDVINIIYSWSEATQNGTYAVFRPSFSGGVITLVEWGNPGEVVLPVIANHIAVFTNTTGTIGDDAATAINGGNIQAGLSGTAGYFASFPATLARGSLRFVAANSAGDTVTQITNASQAAARIYSIPDGGQAASNFLLTDSGGTQTIATGSLALTLGNITAAAGNIAATLGSVSAGTTVTGGTGVTATTGNVTASAGNLVAGAAAAAGTVTSFSGTGANEFLRLSAVDNAGGAFSTTVSNAASVGQSQVVSIPDVGAATGNFLAAGAALVSGEFPVLSGTGGRVTSSGVAASNIQNKTNIIAASTADIGGGGAGPISVVVAGLTTSSKIVATIASSSNVVAVAKCIATATGFDITFTADPGAACVVNYVAFIVAQ